MKTENRGKHLIHMKPGQHPPRGVISMELSIKQKAWLAEYLKTYNATAAYRRVYGKRKDPQLERNLAHSVKTRPSMKKAIDEAMVKLEMDEEFAVGRLKKVITSGEANLGDTQPKDVLKGLEMLFKLKGYLGNQQNQQNDEEKELQSMTVDQIARELQELDKKQTRLLTIVGGAEEGEVVHELPKSKRK